MITSDIEHDINNLFSVRRITFTNNQKNIFSVTIVVTGRRRIQTAGGWSHSVRDLVFPLGRTLQHLLNTIGMIQTSTENSILILHSLDIFRFLQRRIEVNHLFESIE